MNIVATVMPVENSNYNYKKRFLIFSCLILFVFSLFALVKIHRSKKIEDAMSEAAGVTFVSLLIIEVIQLLIFKSQKDVVVKSKEDPIDEVINSTWEFCEYQRIEYNGETCYFTDNIFITYSQGEPKIEIDKELVDLKQFNKTVFCDQENCILVCSKGYIIIHKSQIIIVNWKDYTIEFDKMSENYKISTLLRTKITLGFPINFLEKGQNSTKFFPYTKELWQYIAPNGKIFYVKYMP